jgi:hypothetical protein
VCFNCGLTSSTPLAFEGFGTVTFEPPFSLHLTDAAVFARVRVAFTLDTDETEVRRREVHRSHFVCYIRYGLSDTIRSFMDLPPMALHLTFWLLKFKEPVRNISFLFVFFIFFQDIPYLEEKV